MSICEVSASDAKRLNPRLLASKQLRASAGLPVRALAVFVPAEAKTRSPLKRAAISWSPRFTRPEDLACYTALFRKESSRVVGSRDRDIGTGATFLSGGTCFGLNHTNLQGFIADCGLRIADCLGEYLPGKESAIRNPKSAMATAISHHDIDIKTTCRLRQKIRSLNRDRSLGLGPSGTGSDVLQWAVAVIPCDCDTLREAIQR